MYVRLGLHTHYPGRNKAFLELCDYYYRLWYHYHHLRHQDDLSGRPPRTVTENNMYIGDDLEHKFYPVNSAAAKNVLPEDRVLLPNRYIAEAWGDPAE